MGGSSILLSIISQGEAKEVEAKGKVGHCCCRRPVNIALNGPRLIQWICIPLFIQFANLQPDFQSKRH